MKTADILKKHNYLFLVGIIVALMTFYVPIRALSPVLIAAFGMLFGLFLISYNEAQEQSFLSRLFIISFLLKVVAAVTLYNFVYLHNNQGLLGDGYAYSLNGDTILRMWLGGERNMDIIAEEILRYGSSGNVTSYDFWNAIVYFFTGTSPLSLVFINCMASSLTILFIYGITKQVYNEKAAKITAILTAFWPSIFMWSIQNLKESLSIFLIAILIWVVLQLKVKFRFYLLFLIILSSIALKELRMVSFIMFYAVIFPLSLSLFLWKKNRVLFIFLLLLAGVGITVIFNKYSSYSSPLEYISYMRIARAYGNTAFLSNIDVTNPVSFIFFAPVGLLVAWLAPFPCQIGSMSQIMAIPEMLLYYSLLPAMFLGWRFITRYKAKEGMILIAYIFIMMLLLAFIEGNIGTLFRHRAMVLPFMFVLIGIGIAQKKMAVKYKIQINNE